MGYASNEEEFLKAQERLKKKTLESMSKLCRAD